MAKKKTKHQLTVEVEYDYEMLGICSHHVDYRLVFGLNKQLDIALEKCDENFCVSNKKGQVTSNHSFYQFIDEENLIEYYLIKNKHEGKFLIPEKPLIDYFLFIRENYVHQLDELIKEIKSIKSVLGVYEFNPEELASAEHLVFE